jgi:hypothetical protein
MGNIPKPVPTQQKRELFNKAYEMVMRGWSVIPLRGASDLAKPKAPALPSWKDYQTRKPRFPELEQWFVENGYGAIGVILGRVSGIVVIDIDKPEIEIAFKNALPHLTHTYTVRSGNRKLPHYYYALPHDMDAPARTGVGIEFRSDGQYVVAPNTVIGDAMWRVENPFAPKILTPSDLRAIYDFLGLYTRKVTKTPLEMPLKAQEMPIQNIPISPKSEKLTLEGLRRWYIENARIYGRNNALFAGGCYARDLGWTETQVMSALIGTHVTQPANGDHIPETTSQRMDEARRTLGSVFKRLAKPRHHQKRALGLPNIVRERFLQMGLDNIARVLDGLFLAGIQPNSAFTAQKACDVLGEMGIGKNAVYGALSAVLENGQSVVAVSQSPEGTIPLPPHPLHPSAIADSDKYLSPTQCLSGRGTNAGKNRGRPVRQFIMPSPESLCMRLGVKDMGSDPISRDDVGSVSAYRLALHKAMITRAPKPYGREWQAKRLGIHKKTIRRYDKKAGIMAMPTFISKPVGWMNWEKECPDEVEYGVFVTDETGKRHPAKKRMVQKLLAQKHTLTLHRQGANFYFMPDHHAMPDDVRTESRTALLPSLQSPLQPDYKQKWTVALERAMNTFTASDMPAIPHSMPRLMAEQLGFARTYPQADVVTEWGQYALPLRDEKRRVAKYVAPQPTSPKRGLDADEVACADGVYATLREMSADKSITKKLARQWVKDYGTEAIERGLTTLRRKTDVRNPAGYLRTLLRVEARLKEKSQ